MKTHKCNWVAHGIDLHWKRIKEMRSKVSVPCLSNEVGDLRIELHHYVTVTLKVDILFIKEPIFFENINIQSVFF